MRKIFCLIDAIIQVKIYVIFKPCNSQVSSMRNSPCFPKMISILGFKFILNEQDVGYSRYGLLLYLNKIFLLPYWRELVNGSVPQRVVKRFVNHVPHALA